MRHCLAAPYVILTFFYLRASPAALRALLRVPPALRPAPVAPRALLGRRLAAPLGRRPSLRAARRSAGASPCPGCPARAAPESRPCPSDARFSADPSIGITPLLPSSSGSSPVAAALGEPRRLNEVFNMDDYPLGAQNAWDMLSDEQSQKHITTGSGDLNHILGGGVHCKEVTEIGGVPGVGKTQLGIQLAINVQIPVEYGGLGGKAVYIDTEGSFMVERVYQIAEGCISDILEHFPHSHEKSSSGHKQLQPEHFLADIYYFRICSYTEQIAVINYLEKFLGEHKDVRIVIIDSVTFHFRQDFDDLALRTRVLSGLSLKLMKIAKTYNLAVVLLNQVTTKFIEGSFQLALALGDSWSHSCTNRVILYWNGNERYAYLDKSPSLPVASAPYAVTGKGVRDAVNSNHKRARVT